jgi:hypothetical protein
MIPLIKKMSLKAKMPGLKLKFLVGLISASELMHDKVVSN